MLVECKDQKELFASNEYFPFVLDKENILLTTRHGKWAVLSKKEYEKVKRKDIDTSSELFLKLKNKGIVIAKDNIGHILTDLRRKNGFLLRYPSYHVIDVTDKCNMNCIYCHPDAKPEKNDMTRETADKVLSFIFSIPSDRAKIVIEGGEPLLKWDLIKYIYGRVKKENKEKRKDYSLSFMTNLTLMTDKIAQKLTKMDIHVGVSFDGPKELHNRQRPFRGGKGTYDTIIYWHKKLKEKYNINLGFLPLITRISLEYGPKAIVDEFLKHGVNMVFFKAIRPSGRALENWQKLEMKPEEFFAFWKEGIEYCLELNKKGIKVKERSAGQMLAGILTDRSGAMCQRRPCGAGGFPMLSYETDGSIFACDSVRSIDFFNLGNVEKDSYSSVREKALPLLGLAPDLIPVCSSCPFMAYCGMCLAEVAGTENDIYPKIPRSFSCKWQKMAFKYLFKKLAKDTEDSKILRGWVSAFSGSQPKPLCRV